MNIYLGRNKWDASKKIFWTSDNVVNGHILIVGGSGSGKTFTIRKITEALSKGRGSRVYIFDIEGDIKPGNSITSSVKFSETSEYGLRLLDISPDIDFGGVRKRVRHLVYTVNTMSRKLGIKQISVLQNALYDLYSANGFYADKPETWSINYDPRRNDYAKRFPKKQPTLQDLIRFLDRKLKQMFLGANSKSMYLLEQHIKRVVSLESKYKKSLKDADVDLETSKQKCIESYVGFVENIETGREIEDLIKYDSKDVLKSVLDHLRNLYSTGIFKNKAPEFDPSKPVWRYDISSLSREEQKIFINIALEDIFLKEKSKGLAEDGPRTFIVVDEAKSFIDDNPENQLNIGVLQGRKFGIGYILASQNFGHMNEDIISNVATKIILGVDEMYQKQAADKLRVDVKRLGYIMPHKSAMVQVKRKGSSSNHFDDVLIWSD